VHTRPFFLFKGIVLRTNYHSILQGGDPFSKIELVLTKRKEDDLQVFGADFFLDHRSGGIEVGHTAFSFVLYPYPHGSAKP
jgi:hypothetical protein